MGSTRLLRRGKSRIYSDATFTAESNITGVLGRYGICEGGILISPRAYRAVLGTQCLRDVPAGSSLVLADHLTPARQAHRQAVTGTPKTPGDERMYVIGR
ncbi:hypothetical protein Bbelb_112630 [Branchiostoma belcheri]|nr:hypothetical protein Bbelb_112630 [Branchiostoma belcheri]